MNAVSQTTTPDPLIHAAGGFAIVSGIISAIGVVFLIIMFALFATPNRTLGLTFGMLNDICVAIQYLLAIPIALALYRNSTAAQPGADSHRNHRRHCGTAGRDQAATGADLWRDDL